jgi:hypothetical protein
MFATDEVLKATMQAREEEAGRLIRLKEANAARRPKKARGWRWRVEPGMEESFRCLLGWVIPGRDSKGGAGSSSEPRAA